MILETRSLTKLSALTTEEFSETKEMEGRSLNLKLAYISLLTGSSLRVPSYLTSLAGYQIELFSMNSLWTCILELIKVMIRTWIGSLLNLLSTNLLGRTNSY